MSDWKRISIDMTESDLSKKFAGPGFIMDRWKTLFTGWYSYNNYGSSHSYWCLAPVNMHGPNLLGEYGEYKLDYPIFWISRQDVIRLIRENLVAAMRIQYN